MVRFFGSVHEGKTLKVLKDQLGMYRMFYIGLEILPIFLSHADISIFPFTTHVLKLFLVPRKRIVLIGNYSLY